MESRDGTHDTVEHVLLKDDGRFPNNERLPLLIYRNAIVSSGRDTASVIEKTFLQNGWGGSWRNGIYTKHHYHSTAHEALGVYRGSATVQLGGDGGIKSRIYAGDVVVIPAGVAHKRLDSTSDFMVVGVYPAGQMWDMNYGKAGERPRTDDTIAGVPIPESDPVYGVRGPLKTLWV